MPFRETEPGGYVASEEGTEKKTAMLNAKICALCA
jgi:hypothetical protein